MAILNSYVRWKRNGGDYDLGSTPILIVVMPLVALLLVRGEEEKLSLLSQTAARG
jgi:hypothetical protein